MQNSLYNKKIERKVSWLLVIAVVLSSLVLGLGNISVSAQTQAVGQMGTYRFRVKTSGQDCGGTGTANDFALTINYTDGTSFTSATIAGESSPNYFEAGNTDTIQLSPAMPAKPISSISFNSMGSDRWKVDWTALDYLEGSSWRQIATTGDFDYSGGVRSMTYPSEYSLNTSSLNKTITFNANGGMGGKQIYSISGATLPSSNVPTVTRTGYSFSGWSPVVPTTGPSANTTYTAQWTANTYTVTFNTNGGATPSPTSKTVTFGGTYGTLATVSRTGYTFNGWFTAASGGTKIESTTAVTSASNHSLYAQWTINSYTIAFNGNGGTTPASITQQFGTAVTAPANPTRTGYTFTGWSPTVPATMPANNTTCVAQWTINQYTISFDSGGGSPVDSITQNYGTAVTAPGNPTRTGYTFGSWSPAVPSVMPAINTNCIAQWTANTYFVAFNANGGTGTMSSQAFVYATAQNLTANAFSRTGYTFAGWNTQANGSGASYSNGQSVNNLTTTNGATVTLYAQWSISTISITFDGNGGTGGWSQSMQFGAPLTPPTVTRAGYTFAGWSPTPPSTVPGINSIYIAQWTINQYTVSFETNGGTAVSPITQNYNMAVTQPPIPTKTGSTFAGWYSNPGLTNAVAWPYTLTGDVTFYAKWTVNSYTISFNSAGGTAVSSITDLYGSVITAPMEPIRPGYTFSQWSPELPSTMPDSNLTCTAQWVINQYTVSFHSNGGSEVPPVTQNFGTLLSQPEAPSKAGYAFAGWYTDAELTDPVPWPYTLGAANALFFAKWAESAFSIYFNANGGMGTMANQILPKDASAALIPNTFTRTGYSFSGWNTTADGNGTAYADEVVYGPMGEEDITLYAQWSINTYEITFDAGDGQGGELQTVDYGTVPIAPEVTREGYSFIGWTPEVVEATEDAIYTALWTINTYEITFDADGGQGGEVQTVDYGALPVAPEVTRDGYTFAGWMPEIIAVAENATYTAQWIINTYEITFDADGGQGGEMQTVEYGTLPVAPDVTREGYTFAGWTPAIVEATEDATYTALWTINTYEITFDADGGQGGEVQTVENGTLPIAPEVTREGYTFAGWTPAIVEATEDATYTAQWTINTYDAVFMVDGEVYATVPTVFGESIAVPADPEKEGYLFEGWDPAPDTIGAGDMTFNALWRKIPATLTAKDGSAAIVDDDNGFIYGLPEGMTAKTFVRDYIEIGGDGVLRITFYTDSFGTGTKVELLDAETGEVVKTYYIVIFGDTDGDGYITGSDENLMAMAAAQQGVFEAGSPFAFAADLNGDGAVDSADLDIVREVVRFLRAINQSDPSKQNS